LSEHALEGLRLIAASASKHDVAERLSIADLTGKRRVSHILNKPGISSQIQAVAAARDFGPI
jgi:ATP/maltotriose-dependent transcriptional regulator MalT